MKRIYLTIFVIFPFLLSAQILKGKAVKIADGDTFILPSSITPSRISSLEPNEIFVFGSNIQGMHIGGAARVAYIKFGAGWKNGELLQGQSYAMPTMKGTENTTVAACSFTVCAKEHPELKFYVTPAG